MILNAVTNILTDLKILKKQIDLFGKDLHNQVVLMFPMRVFGDIYIYNGITFKAFPNTPFGEVHFSRKIGVYAIKTRGNFNGYSEPIIYVNELLNKYKLLPLLPKFNIKGTINLNNYLTNSDNFNVIDLINLSNKINNPVLNGIINKITNKLNYFMGEINIINGVAIYNVIGDVIEYKNLTDLIIIYGELKMVVDEQIKIEKNKQLLIVQPPVIQPPVIQPPVIQPPVIQPPVIQPPVIQPPVIQPHVIQTHVVQTPVIQPPTVQASIDQPEKLEIEQKKINILPILLTVAAGAILL